MSVLRKVNRLDYATLEAAVVKLGVKNEEINGRSRTLRSRGKPSPPGAAEMHSAVDIGKHKIKK